MSACVVVVAGIAFDDVIVVCVVAGIASDDVIVVNVLAAGAIVVKIADVIFLFLILLL